MVKVKGNIYDTVEISRPSAPYITLEILSKDKNICKGSHKKDFEHSSSFLSFYTNKLFSSLEIKINVVTVFIFARHPCHNIQPKESNSTW